MYEHGQHIWYLNFKFYLHGQIIYGREFEGAHYNEQVPDWEGKARVILRVPYIRIILLSQNIDEAEVDPNP